MNSYVRFECTYRDIVELLGENKYKLNQMLLWKHFAVNSYFLILMEKLFVSFLKSNHIRLPIPEVPEPIQEIILYNLFLKNFSWCIATIPCLAPT